MEWKTVYRTFNPNEAQLMKSNLESAGFHVNIAGELDAVAVGFPVAAGGLRIQVPEAEVEDARALIESSEENKT